MFTPEQNKALRGALIIARDERGVSQAKLGEIIGCNQQNAGRLLRDGGFSYGSATRLARFLGYAGVDAFFVKMGVALPSLHRAS